MYKTYEGFFKNIFKKEIITEPVTKDKIIECFMDIIDSGFEVYVDMFSTDINGEITTFNGDDLILVDISTDYGLNKTTLIIETIKFAKSYIESEYGYKITQIDLPNCELSYNNFIKFTDAHDISERITIHFEKNSHKANRINYIMRSPWLEED